jgi:hypothetical protein
MGIIEAEAAAKGISVPELCRRIIIERNQPVERQMATVQMTSIPTPLASVVPRGSSRIETQAPSPVGLSQNAEAAIVAATAAMEMAKMRAEFPELSPPTGSMIRANEDLAKLATERPEAIGAFLAKEKAEGRMSDRDIARFLKDLGF